MKRRGRDDLVWGGLLASDLLEYDAWEDPDTEEGS